ncbi:hypothetical protein [Allosphingosinicella vermicomposti]|uniref:hypothetical protein n=1 Tax=Allosphingosinicella vermicomposti TaxID=614671 RepID=UPI00131A56D1|nr:hypothetical protein [Allosphingosinicella vermicomposti]
MDLSTVAVMSQAGPVPFPSRNSCNFGAEHTFYRPMDRINPRNEAMVNASSRRFVKVAPPTVHAGIGNALREAFAMDGELRSLQGFQDLLAKLD